MDAAAVMEAKTQVWEEFRDSILKVADWSGGSHFNKGGPECSNYRGITLLSLPGKSYSRVMERRLGRVTVDQLLPSHACTGRLRNFLFRSACVCGSGEHL